MLKEAALKAEKTRRASTVAIKRRETAIKEAEEQKIASEKERQKRREANAKRAQVSVSFGVICMKITSRKVLVLTFYFSWHFTQLFKSG